jgi:hypothetical protein
MSLAFFLFSLPWACMASRFAALDTSYSKPGHV